MLAFLVVRSLNELYPPSRRSRKRNRDKAKQVAIKESRLSPRTAYDTMDLTPLNAVACMLQSKNAQKLFGPNIRYK